MKILVWWLLEILQVLQLPFASFWLLVETCHIVVSISGVSRSPTVRFYWRAYIPAMKSTCHPSGKELLVPSMPIFSNSNIQCDRLNRKKWTILSSATTPRWGKLQESHSLCATLCNFWPQFCSLNFREHYRKVFLRMLGNVFCSPKLHGGKCRSGVASCNTCTWYNLMYILYILYILYVNIMIILYTILYCPSVW